MPGRDFTARIVVTGSECTGKTSLAQELALALDAPLTLEAARLYGETSEQPLSLATVEPIARLSMRIEDETIAQAGGSPPPLLVRDTDLVSTVVFAHHYYGKAPAWIELEARARRGDLYLLCAPDIPWRPDSLRDRPLAREEIHEAFIQHLNRIGARVVTIQGTGRARFVAALAAVRVWRAARARAEATSSRRDPGGPRTP